MPTNDLWMPVGAMEHGTELATPARDFKHVPESLVAHYER
jgi:hypothetical protein